jgi:hypothetical protein
VRGRPVVGEERHLLSAVESGVNGSGVAASGGAHTHGVTDPGHAHAGRVSVNRVNADGSLAHTGDLGGGVQDTQVITSSLTGVSIQSGGTHTHPLTARAADTAHNNIPPAVASATIVRIA